LIYLLTILLTKIGDSVQSIGANPLRVMEMCAESTVETAMGWLLFSILLFIFLMFLWGVMFLWGIFINIFDK